MAKRIVAPKAHPPKAVKPLTLAERGTALGARSGNSRPSWSTLEVTR